MSEYLWGIASGWISLFVTLLYLSIARSRTGVSSVTTVDENGRASVKTAYRGPERTGGRDGNRSGENSIEAVGENVHAVIKRERDHVDS